jgi:transposase
MTEKSVELVDGLIVKAGANGRRTYSRQAKRALVQMCRTPGISVAGLALAHGVNANLLRRWISQDTGSQDELRVGTRAAVLPVTTTQTDLAVAAVGSGSIEISLKSASVRIRGSVDRETLESVLACLARRA